MSSRTPPLTHSRPHSRTRTPPLPGTGEAGACDDDGSVAPDVLVPTDIDPAYVRSASGECRVMLCHPRAGRTLSFRSGGGHDDADTVRAGFIPELGPSDEVSDNLRGPSPPRVTVTVEWFGERIGNGDGASEGDGSRRRHGSRSAHDRELLSLKEWVRGAGRGGASMHNLTQAQPPPCH